MILGFHPQLLGDDYKSPFNDGFESLQDFFNWFNKPFRGKIIHWTDFKY